MVKLRERELVVGDLAWESYPQKAGAGPARTVSYAYSRGYLTAVQEGSTTYASFSYHPSGLVARRQRSNGTRDEIVADSSGMARVGNIQVYGPGGALLWQTGSYAYDGAGNVKAMGGDRYWYDKVSRLVGAQVGGKSFGASYNAFGFMTGMAKNGAWQTFVADAGGGTNRISGVGYDGAGQVTSFWGRVFGWYPTGQLRSVGWSGQSLTFGYDASGERMGWSDSTEVGVRYTFRGLSGQVLREYFELNGTWSWVKDYVWGGNELVATVEPTGVKHLHRDHLGSTRLETSGTGTVVASHTYWPFGEEMTATSSTERYRFAGHERDLGSGYDSMHARSYASVNGRFFSPDPVRGNPAQPQSLNLYAYVANNPVNWVDPDGMRAEVGTVSVGDDLNKLLQQLEAKIGIRLGLARQGRSRFIVILGDLLKEGRVHRSEVSGIARALVAEMINSSRTFVVNIVRNDRDIIGGKATRETLSDHLIGRESGITIDAGDLGSAEFHNVPEATFDLSMAFLHEAGHVVRGLSDPSPWLGRFTGELGEVEKLISNPIRQKLGLPKRGEYVSKRDGQRYTVLFEGGYVDYENF
jgi:RHS repeat-associated protein